ncbi:Hsp20/alpha crystallin family protein [Halolamina litorea]|uniref:Hsp20/alpha crystallin family protein n=1 Tax=Halolamina litorea TaxID=1515593 RepID=A0ABD6BS65_9EURY|nr:Hsp20/alpha crystallin family protein [Halolamina litorea]
MTDRRDPFKEIEELFEQLNDGFADMSREFGEEFGDDLAANVGGRAIHVDVADAGDEIVVVADVPGFDVEDIDVSVTDRQLSIAAEHSETTEDEETEYYRRERSQRAVSRTVPLPTDVEEREANASYENGVLTVTLPKADEDGGIDIEVS